MAGVRVVIGGDASAALAAIGQAESALARMRQTASSAASTVSRMGSSSGLWGLPSKEDVAAAQAALGKVGTAGQVSAAQTAQAWRMLPAQMSDVASQLASGASPLMILVQQGGQVKDAFGGIGPMFTALAGAITPAVVGLGALAAVLAVFGLAAYEASDRQADLRRSLVLTGNRAAVNADSLDQLAKGVADTARVSVGAARDIASAALATGAFGPQAFGPAVQAMTTLQAISGRSANEVVGDFASMSRGVAAWAAEHNRQYAFLTKAQYDHIKLLQDQGRTEEAMTVASTLFDQALRQRRDELQAQVGVWGNLKIAIGNAYESLVQWASGPSLEQQIADLQERIAQPLPVSKDATLRNKRAADEQRLAALQQQKEERDARNSERARLAGEDGGQIDDAASGRAAQLANAQIDGRIAADQALSAAVLGGIQSRQAAQDAAYQLGLLSLRQYETGRIALIRQAGAEQVAALQKQRDQEASRPGDTPAEEQARANRVAAVDAQIAAARRSTVRDVAAAQAQAEAAAVQAARDNAQQWAAAWTQAADQVKAWQRETAAASADAMADPADRLLARAQAQADELQRTMATMLRDLGNQRDMAAGRGEQGQAAEIQAQMDLLQRVFPGRVAAVFGAAQREIDALRRATQDYADQLTQTGADTAKGNARALGQAGWGDERRQAQSRRDAIDDDYTAKLRDLERQRVSLGPKDYEARLSALQTYHGQALEEEASYQARLDAQRADGSLGFQRAFGQFQEQARDVSKAMESVWTTAFSGMADAVTDFVTKGKADFSSLAASIITDLIRIQVRAALVQAMTGVQGWFGAGASGGTPVNGSAGTPTMATFAAKGLAMDGWHAFARGGVVDRPTPFRFAAGGMMQNGLMGEAGPEAIMPLRRGADGVLGVRAAVSGAAAPNVQVQVINQSGSAMEASTSRRSDGTLEVILRAVKQAVADDVASGTGDITRALGGRYGLRPQV
jgi:lambda family phage tail tape measure protein